MSREMVEVSERLPPLYQLVEVEVIDDEGDIKVQRAWWGGEEWVNDRAQYITASVLAWRELDLGEVDDEKRRGAADAPGGRWP